MADNRQVQTVLATVQWSEEEVEQLRAAFAPAEFIHCSPADAVTIAQALQRADVAVLAGDLDAAVLAAPKLRWVHCDHAGLNDSARPEVFERGLLVTGSAGRSGHALAQHAFYFTLAFTYDIRNSLARQDSRTWDGGEEFRDRPALWGQRLGIVGFGYTGQGMARLGRAFGMHVSVYRRSVGEDSADVDVMLSADRGDSWDELLTESDVIMLATNLSDETYHLFGAAEFKRMKNSAVIINMARGAVIDESALVAALQDGEIAAAGLDVFETEPLPRESPLWTLPNVLVTPHATPKMPDKTQRSIDVIVENISLFEAGLPLRNALSPRDLYTRGRN